MLVATLFMIAKGWNKPSNPSVYECWHAGGVGGGGGSAAGRRGRADTK